MKLTNEQWEELRLFVGDDDQRSFETLVQITLNHAERLRRAERAKAERARSPGGRPYMASNR